MVNFLRSSDILRITFLLVILLLIRIPFIIKGIPLTIPELYWQLIGEKMADGFSMYQHIWEPLEPLSAGTYYFIDKLFGRSPIAYYVINIFIVGFQALYFLFLTGNNNVYNERSVFPAFLYILFASLCFDFFTLPPVLLGMTFMLPAFYLILLQIRFKMSDEGMLYAGLMVGLAAMFYLPYLVFIPFLIFGLALFSAGELRKYFLFIIGSFLPGLIIFMYYFFMDSSNEFLNVLVFSYFKIAAEKYIDFKFYLILAIVPAIITFLGVSAISGRTTYVNYQFNVFKFANLWLLGGLATLIITLNFTPSQLYVFVPAIAYISSHFFLLIKHRLTTEITFWLLVVFVPLILIIYYNDAKKDPKNGTFKNYLVKPVKNLPVDVQNKKIVVLGTDPGAYLNSKLSTPYLNWKLSKSHFERFNNLKVLTDIHKNFERDLPEVILDQKGAMEEIFKQMPVLDNQYQRVEHDNAWVLKEIK